MFGETMIFRKFNKNRIFMIFKDQQLSIYFYMPLLIKEKGTRVMAIGFSKAALVSKNLEELPQI